MKGLPIKPREISTPAPIIDLTAALKRSLAQAVPTSGGRTTKEKQTRTKPDRRQPSLLLPVPGGGKRKEQPDAERTTAATTTRRKKA
jgi:hypothetical protein